MSRTRAEGFLEHKKNPVGPGKGPSNSLLELMAEEGMQCGPGREEGREWKEPGTFWTREAGGKDW